jgi:hypothetical protein
VRGAGSARCWNSIRRSTRRNKRPLTDDRVVTPGRRFFGAARCVRLGITDAPRTNNSCFLANFAPIPGVSGTAGQPQTELLQGGSYGLTGGFEQPVCPAGEAQAVEVTMKLSGVDVTLT